ncbi:YcdB/YcdC domain-containing protein [Paenibacillus sp. GCM10023252]|uniref:YcdB/YcdC domain-containing protein n=1 Tax=Paenibacillus sp. GCM10023252 TaxID=3252649 RepID=UPI003615C005
MKKLRNNKNGKRAVAIATALVLVSTLPAGVYAQSMTGAIPYDQGSVSSEAGGAAVESGSESAPANVKITKDKAVALARKAVSIPDDYKLQGANFSTDPLFKGERSIWGLEFVNKQSGKVQGTISVRLNADNGQLLGFNSWVNNPNAKPSYPLKVDRTKAQTIALDFLSKQAPQLAGQVIFNPDYGVQLLPPLTGAVTHSFRYNRVVADIPYVDNYMELEVDSEGRVLSYSLQWDETIVFPKVDSKLTAAEALVQVKAASKPVLKYVLPYHAKGERKPILGYEMDGAVIDAVTGKPILQPYRNRAELSASPLDSKPLGEKPKVSSLTEKGAVAAVEAAFKLPEGAELTNSSYNESEDEYSGKVASWNLNWTVKSKDGKGEEGGAWASVDSRTGTVRTFSSYSSGRGDGAAAVTLEQAKTKAIEVIRKQLPWLSHELYLVEPDKEQYENRKPEQIHTYEIGFRHKVNGAIVDYDYVSVGIDGKTGQVSEFHANIQDIAYPEAAPKTLTPAEAVAKWLEFYRVELTYQVNHEFWWGGKPIPVEKYRLMVAAGEIPAGGDSSEDAKEEATVKLVYRLVPRNVDEPLILNAESGQWVNRDTGEVTQLEKPKAADVTGHWAQRELELMVAYKALDVKDGKVRPNEIVTRGELIKMLVLAMNSGQRPYLAMDSSSEKVGFGDVTSTSNYYIYVQSALQQNLIDIGDGSFNPEGKVDREEMAQLIVRALGYNSLADYEELFNISFKDAAKVESKGQAAIVVGLKIMSLTDGNFRPDRQVSRAEASAAFFRYLQTRAELQEASLRN